MATDQQVALSRSHHRLSSAPSSHGSKPSRPVPAFLHKLYEMVNDPQNVALIRWADSGDSFFVLDHERFAREILGRWFKHQNFASFVRQLNMYGFHKIPHLQQGVLRSDSETEFWNFAHANFHRGQPDLLYFIQRKKGSSQQQQQMQQQIEEVAAAAAAATAAGLLTDVNSNTAMGAGAPGAGSNAITGASSPNAAANTLGASGAGSAGVAALNNSQILDIHSIVQGIAAIKRHQAAISVELRELKQSNEMLWQDALLAREKHQKQEDTINRIVKFLAGVFGKHAPPGSGGVGGDGHGGGHHGDDENPGTNVSVQRRGGGGAGHPQQDMHQGGNDGMDVVPRRRVRLMIEDGRKSNKSFPSKQGLNVVEVMEEDEDTMMNDSRSPQGNTGSGIGGGVRREQLTSPVTLSDYRSPSPAQGAPDSNDDTTTSSFSALDLNGGPGPVDATHGAHDGLDYPRIEMEIETPKSVNTPLPTSPAETITGSSEKGDTTSNSLLLAALSSERALARTPPAFPGSQANSTHGHSASNDNTGLSFDPRSLTINLTPAQIQQLLASLATQTISDPSNNPNGYSGNHGDQYERGFLTAVEGDARTATPKRNDATRGPPSHTQLQPSGTPPFDISSYLVPSPMMANLSIGSATSGSTATSPAPSVSTPTTSPMLSNTAPRSEGGAYRSRASSNSVPVPDGLISFDGPDAHAAAASAQAANAAPAATTNPATGNAHTVPYAGDLSVLPWGGYQGYGAYPPPVVPNTGGTNGAYGTAPAGYPGYGFSYMPDAGWGNVGSGAPDGGVDYSGLFTPLQASPRSAYSASTATGASGPGTDGVPSQAQGQSQNNDAGAAGSYNPSTAAAAGTVGQHAPHLAALANSWQGAEDIDRDVSAMNTSIHSLIQMLGLDPSLMDTASVDGGIEEGDDEEDVEGASASGPTPKVSGTSRKNGVVDYEHFMNAWGNPGVDIGGSMNQSPSESATTGSGSTPPGASSVASHAGSVAGEGSEGFGDGEGVEGPEEGVIPPSTGLAFALGKAGTASASHLVSASARPQSAQSMGSNVVTADDGTARPINKKARTGLTGSAATSAGVPTTVIEAGGRKRRSAIVNVPTSSAADDLDGADGEELASQVQTKSAASVAGKGTKSKKRRG